MSQMFLDYGPSSEGKQKVMLATPVYDAPDASYTFAISKSREALTKAGIKSAYLLLSGNTHVDDGRNNVLHEFLQTDCTDLIFLDADVSWDEKDLVKLCGFNCDIVGGVYPFRRENSNGMPYRPLECARPSNGIIEVEGLPTGFMRIKRHVIEDMAAHSPKYYSKKDKRHGIPLIFERTLEAGTRWGGDLNFCNKFRANGGKIYAATEFRLGHACKSIIKDSLGAYIRRNEGSTLYHVAQKVKSAQERPEDYTEALELLNNDWGAQEEILMIAVAAARKADGPIIETGSGLTTVLMAAATDQTVYAIEHNKFYADRLKDMAYAAGVGNIAVVHCDIRDGWYDIDDALKDMPEHFAVGLNDGPPRQEGDRMKFFDVLGDKISFIISDDADNQTYADSLTTWADSKNREIIFPDFRSAVIKEAA